MGSYEIFKRDIEPKGFHVIPIEDFITEETVKKAALVLRNPDYAVETCELNYELGRRYYSYQVLKGYLEIIVNQVVGV
jgi:hypothetical protein